VGTVHIGVVTPETTAVTSLVLAGTRGEIRQQTVDAALAALLRAVRE
jgi:nicotinamide-nucleotide amidase